MYFIIFILYFMHGYTYSHVCCHNFFECTCYCVDKVFQNMFFSLVHFHNHNKWILCCTPTLYIFLCSSDWFQYAWLSVFNHKLELFFWVLLTTLLSNHTVIVFIWTQFKEIYENKSTLYPAQLKNKKIILVYDLWFFIFCFIDFTFLLSSLTNPLYPL